jgi:hypothetical protein
MFMRSICAQMAENHIDGGFWTCSPAGRRSAQSAPPPVRKSSSGSSRTCPGA